MKKIPLTKGAFSIVDDEDYQFLSQWSWWLSQRPGRGRYACRKLSLGGGKDTTIGMHNYLLPLPAGYHVDHINGDGLDNRKENIRPATSGQNQMNRFVLTGNRSGYRGVCWNKKSNKWQAGIKHDGQSYHLGLFDNKRDAALAYDVAARRLFGEYARPNFPDQPSSLAA